MIEELENAEVGDTVTVGDENPEFEVLAIDECPDGFGGEAYRELFGDEYSILIGDTAGS